MSNENNRQTDNIGQVQPEFLPPCKNGGLCHQSTPRGTKLGLQGIQDKTLRSACPPKLCEQEQGTTDLTD